MVVQGDGLVYGLELEDVDDGSKDLLVDDRCIGTDLNNGRLDIVAGTWELLASVKDSASLCLDLL